MLFCTADSNPTTHSLMNSTNNSLNFLNMIMHFRLLSRLKTTQKECFLCTN